MVLGAALPTPALHARGAPAAPGGGVPVQLGGIRHRPAGPRELAEVVDSVPVPPVVVGGPGWDPAHPPAGALVATTMTRAADLLSSLVPA